MIIRRPGDKHIYLPPGLIRVRGGKGGGAVRSYATILRDDYAASEIWPLVNIASGTTITAFINSARNGAETGWALQNAAGPVPGTLAPLSDGVNDVGNIYSPSLNIIFDGNEGSLFGYCQVLNAGVWTDQINRTVIHVNDNASNYFLIRKTSSNNTIIFYRVGGGGSKAVSATGLSSTDIFSYGCSWSVSNDAFRAYINGVEVGIPETSLLAWTGDGLTAGQTAIGSITSSGLQVWSGWQAYTTFKFGSIWTPAEFAGMHAAAATAGAD